MKTLFDTDFDKYDYLHPDIWIEFEKITLELIKAGRWHYGAKAVLEVIRYKRSITSTKNEAFKVNNNFTCGYSRKFMAKYPEHSQFFETRKAKQI